MQRKLNVDCRVTETHGEFERPRLSVTIDDAVDIDIADIADALELVAEGLEDLVEKLRGPHQADYRSGFAAVWPQGSGKEPLLLKILLDPVDKPAGSKPRPNRELDTLDPIL